MSKIICDICGTTYQDTAPCCPICGCTRDAAASLLGDELLGEEIMDEPRGRGGHFTASKKKKEIFDFDEVNTRQSAPPREDEDDLGEEPEYDEGPQHNTAAVILLTALIAVLLLAAGYLVVRYFLPGRGNDANTPASETQTMSSEETTNSVPCTNLVLMSGEAKLYSNGAQYLINVAPQPADTTDKLIYRSADESVATVDENDPKVAKEYRFDFPPLKEGRVCLPRYMYFKKEFEKHLELFDKLGYHIEVVQE